MSLNSDNLDAFASQVRFVERQRCAQIVFTRWLTMVPLNTELSNKVGEITNALALDILDGEPFVGYRDVDDSATGAI